jgi:hypothetical protein
MNNIWFSKIFLHAVIFVFVFVVMGFIFEEAIIGHENTLNVFVIISTLALLSWPMMFGFMWKYSWFIYVKQKLIVDNTVADSTIIEYVRTMNMIRYFKLTDRIFKNKIHYNYIHRHIYVTNQDALMQLKLKFGGKVRDNYLY